MQRMMKIIAPLRIDFIPTAVPRCDDPRVVQITFRNQVNFPAKSLRQFSHIRLQFRQEVQRAEIENSMDRVQPKRVEVILVKPIECILPEKSPYLVAPRSVVIDGLSPWRAISIREIWAVSSKIIPFRTKMVVDNVQSHRQTQ